MTADVHTSVELADGLAHEARVDPAAARGRAGRDAWRRQPRCTRCGRWLNGPGGAGFGNGHTFCDPCALRLDFERGEGVGR